MVDAPKWAPSGWTEKKEETKKPEISEREAAAAKVKAADAEKAKNAAKGSADAAKADLWAKTEADLNTAATQTKLWSIIPPAPSGWGWSDWPIFDFTPMDDFVFKPFRDSVDYVAWWLLNDFNDVTKNPVAKWTDTFLGWLWWNIPTSKTVSNILNAPFDVLGKVTWWVFKWFDPIGKFLSIFK